MPYNQVTILLVEDDPRDAELALRALGKSNLVNHVHHVSDGVEALAFIFATGKYSERRVENTLKLVLLDLKLPRIDGLEVLKRIKADERTRKIPVVALTSSKAESDVAKSYELGINSYLVKPVEFDRFVDAVDQVCLYWLLMNNVPR